MRLAFLLLIAVGLAGCGGVEKKEASKPPAPKAEGANTSAPKAAAMNQVPDTAAEVASLLQRGQEFRAAGQYDNAFAQYCLAAGKSRGGDAFQAATLCLDLAKLAQGKARLLREDAALRCYFRGAITGHAPSALKLAHAFQDGLAVKPDLTEAYTWLVIAKKMDATLSLERLDSLVVKLDNQAVEKAQATALSRLAGQWPEEVAPQIVQGDSRLKISGISRGGGRASVLINRTATLMVGDSASLAPLETEKTSVFKKLVSSSTNTTVALRCEAIGSDYVLLKVDGEKQLRLLSLAAL